MIVFMLIVSPSASDVRLDTLYLSGETFSAVQVIVVPSTSHWLKSIILVPSVLLTIVPEIDPVAVLSAVKITWVIPEEVHTVSFVLDKLILDKVIVLTWTGVFVFLILFIYCL